jgi:hypothetical protein
MRKRAVKFIAVREYMRDRSRSHISDGRGGGLLGIGVGSTLCGMSAGIRITGLPVSKVSCSDCRAIYRSTVEQVS